VQVILITKNKVNLFLYKPKVVIESIIKKNSYRELTVEFILKKRELIETNLVYRHVLSYFHKKIQTI
jgi:hypothetical protein